MKLLLVGWDAADWKIISPLIEAGEMPNLKRFVENGVAGNLSTLYPVLSPMLWTSIATGKRPYKHGIHGFVEPHPDTGGVRPVSSVGRKTKAIWNILNQQGLRSNVVSWWPSNPPEPINGVMVSDLFHKAKGNSLERWPARPVDVQPSSLTDTLREFRVHPSEITAEEVLPFLDDTTALSDDDPRLFSLAKILAECASVHALSTTVMANTDWDFMAVYHDAVDHACHGFMKYHPPRLNWVSPDDFAIYNQVVNGVYKFHDMMLGQLVELAGPDTLIMLCSDHGFHADHMRPRELPNEPAGAAEEHRQFGIFAAMGPGIKKDELVFGASLLDITPTILHAYNLPIGEDMDGKVLTSIFEQERSVERVSSWDDVAGDAGMHAEGVRADVVEEHEAMQQLVDLGYIDDVDEDRAQAAERAKRELRVNLARDYIGANLHVHALPILEDLWQQDETEGRFGILIFDCQLAVGDTAAAEKTLALLRERKTRSAAEASEQLAALTERAEHDETATPDQRAVRQRRKLLAKSRTNEATFSFLTGKLRLSQKRFGDALQAFQAASKVQLANRQALYLQIGHCHLKMGSVDEADRAFHAALNLDPVNADAHLGLSSVCAARNQWAEAQDHCQRAIGLYYHNPRAHFMRGLALERQGFVLQAVAAYELAVSQNPGMPQVYRRLSRLYRTYPIDKAQGLTYLKLALTAREQIRDVRRGNSTSKGDLLPKGYESLATLGSIGANVDIAQPLADDEIVIVSGLPRSGTSMVMQMLEAGGIPVLIDDTRAADSDNPRGYYEFARSKARGAADDWLDEAQGKATKVVAQLLPKISPRYRYRIIFIERPLREVLASQRKMLDRLNKTGARSSKKSLAEQFVNQVSGVRDVLARHEDKLSVTSIHYHDVLSDPHEMARQLDQFLGGNLDLDAMAGAVAPELRRQGAS